MRDSTDKLMVQVALTIKAPPGIEITKNVLDDILQRMVNRQALPRNVIVRGVFWRNPNRSGSAGDWRWSADADLEYAPSPLELSPREKRWQDTIPSLGEFLLSAAVSF